MWGGVGRCGEVWGDVGEKKGDIAIRSEGSFTCQRKLVPTGLSWCRQQKTHLVMRGDAGEMQARCRGDKVVTPAEDAPVRSGLGLDKGH